ncbi:MAG TPA: zinc ribbon domain-containing protein [Drouetiella sp.]
MILFLAIAKQIALVMAVALFIMLLVELAARKRKLLEARKQDPSTDLIAQDQDQQKSIQRVHDGLNNVLGAFTETVGAAGANSIANVGTESKLESEPVLSPVSEPVLAPVLDPLLTPVLEPVLAQVLDPVLTPVSEPVLTPILDPVLTPILDPVLTPVNNTGEAIPQQVKQADGKCPSCGETVNPSFSFCLKCGNILS